jgi:hypothetical protein
MNKLTPRLPHFVWSANPLTGGNTSGPAKPVPRCFPNGRDAMTKDT